ncbi:hypothetical protein HIM_00084 [Hirsutella minnesotensis 3608]|nr:hypothetical protein HIM_00084 [Hirsutella minnesotensis 3608]
MAGALSPEPSNTNIAQAIIEAAKKAFDPSVTSDSRELGRKEYDELITRTATWSLIPILNSLIKPTILPSWMSEPLLQTLTRLPLRADGVRSTLEFVFSVHPSNTAAVASGTQPQKNGAGITHEAVAMAMKLLSSVPSTLTPEAWFEGISTQMFALMGGGAGQELAKTAAQIVGFGILGKKQYGAPGKPGWNIFVQPVLGDINPSLRSETHQEDEVVDLRRNQVVVSTKSLEAALRCLNILIISNPSPGLCRRLLKPVIIQLWALASWDEPPPLAEQRYCAVARGLVKTYLRLFGQLQEVLSLVHHLFCIGASETLKPGWRYHLNAAGEIEILASQDQTAKGEVTLDWNKVGRKTASLVDLITSACANKEVASIFLHFFRRWTDAVQQERNVLVHDIACGSDMESPLQRLTEVTFLQKFMEQAPEKLVSHFGQLINVICQVFTADEHHPIGDGLITVVLSLLNMVITASNFQKSDIKSAELELIEKALSRISDEDRADVSTTANNLFMLLKYRDELDDAAEIRPAPNIRQVEDKQTYNLAMGYIAGDGSNPPPVVSEGLNLLSGLITGASPILDITAITVLMSNMLKENEDYINLRVIRIFTQLADKHPQTTVRELLENYLDPQEKLTTDVRLRFGEALLQVIERLGETFAGETAKEVCETLLSMAGRRGYRPKTMAKQEKEERLRSMKKHKAEQDADDADDDAAVDQTMEEAERANRDILAQIIQGWESKRGSEDVRMRTSALSILGVALETNLGAIEPAIVSGAVDLCVHVLTLERELEQGILRRAAVMIILSFVKALDHARESGRHLGFGLTETSRADIEGTLAYIAQTDTDGLVQQHARDVVESLRNWKSRSLLGLPGAGVGAGIGKLAGLQVNPDSASNDGSASRRPRIEEVE